MFKIISIENISGLGLVFLFFGNVTLHFLLGSKWRKTMLLQFQNV